MSNTAQVHTVTVPARPFASGKAPARYLKTHKATENTGKILQIFLNADMRNGHDGLEKLAKDNGINVKELQPGQYVIFVNAHRDRIKLFAAHNVIAYHKLETGRIYDPRVFALIPRAFNGTGRLDMDSALKSVIEEALKKKVKVKKDAASNT